MKNLPKSENGQKPVTLLQAATASDSGIPF